MTLRGCYHAREDRNERLRTSDCSAERLELVVPVSRTTGNHDTMRSRPGRPRVPAASALAIPIGLLWAYCGLAECDRADCGRLLNALSSRRVLACSWPASE